MKGIGKEGEHKFLYNSQTEREDNFDIGLDETPLRLYDPQTGRFLGIDVLAESFDAISPYTYSLNNPVNINDPTGAAPDRGSGHMKYEPEWGKAMKRKMNDPFNTENVELIYLAESLGIGKKSSQNATVEVGEVGSSGSCVECRKANPLAQKGDSYVVSMGAGNTQHYIYEYDGERWIIIDYYFTPADGGIHSGYQFDKVFGLDWADLLNPYLKDKLFTEEDYLNDQSDRAVIQEGTSGFMVDMLYIANPSSGQTTLSFGQRIKALMTYLYNIDPSSLKDQITTINMINSFTNVLDKKRPTDKEDIQKRISFTNSPDVKKSTNVEYRNDGIIVVKQNPPGSGNFTFIHRNGGFVVYRNYSPAISKLKK